MLELTKFRQKLRSTFGATQTTTAASKAGVKPGKRASPQIARAACTPRKAYQSGKWSQPRGK